MCLFCLESHIGIGNLRDRSTNEEYQLCCLRGWVTKNDNLQQERKGEQNAEASNGQIDPLHVPDGGVRVPDVNEYNIRPKHRSDHSPYSIERLGEVDSHLRITRRPADCDIGVRRSFKRAESVSNDEDGSTEAAEALVKQTWPGNQSSESIQTQSPNEDQLVAEVAEDPVGMASIDGIDMSANVRSDPLQPLLLTVKPMGMLRSMLLAGLRILPC